MGSRLDNSKLHYPVRLRLTESQYDFIYAMAKDKYECNLPMAIRKLIDTYMTTRKK
jgi:hypothetical protein